MSPLRFTRLALIAWLAGAALAGAHADSVTRVAPLPQYQQECAACHLAYPPGLLPAASWQRLMASLNRHFGTDASLDDASARAIGAWLSANAGSGKRASETPPQDRITQSAWFLREHNAGEVPAAVWKRPAIGSPAHCAACHRTATEGRFNDHDIRIPQ